MVGEGVYFKGVEGLGGVRGGWRGGGGVRKKLWCELFWRKRKWGGGGWGEVVLVSGGVRGVSGEIRGKIMMVISRLSVIVLWCVGEGGGG